MLQHLINNLPHNLSGIIFSICAFLGTALFLMRMVLVLIGGAFDGHDADALDSYEDSDHGESFKLFTLHSISGFLMIFGWVGLACERQLGFALAQTFGIALAAGLGMLVLVAAIMKGAMLLESSGSVFSNKKAIGLIGTVYQQIPAHGQGKIHVVVDNIMREVLAQSQENELLESFTLVKVVKVIDPAIVEVIAFREDSR